MCILVFVYLLGIHFRFSCFSHLYVSAVFASQKTQICICGAEDNRICTFVN